MNYSSETKAYAVAQYSFGYRSLNDVAKEIGCSRPAIRRWIQAARYRIRTNQEGSLRGHNALQHSFDKRWRKVPLMHVRIAENIYAAYFNSEAHIGAMFDVDAPENCKFVLEYGQYIDRDGYTAVAFDGRVRLAHRLLAASIWGPIHPDDDIHHIDGDPQNNNPDNFEIMGSAEHKALHGRRW